MKPRLIVCRLLAGHRRLFTLATGSVLGLFFFLTAAGGVGAQELDAVPPLEFAPEVKTADGITCTDTSCRGLYSDLVSSVWEGDDGYAGIYVTDAVKPHLAASSTNCQFDHYLVLKLGNETSAKRDATLSRWFARMMFAEVMGNDITIVWEPGSQNCVVRHIFSYPVGAAPP